MQRELERFWRESLAEGKVERPAALAAFFLDRVSRTFALNIRILPPKLKSAVLLAYLFCRMADTLEDDAELDPERKARLLSAFAALFPPDPARMKASWPAFRALLPPAWEKDPEWDRLLVFHGHHVFALANALSEAQLKVVSSCVREMCTGMARFAGRPIPDRKALDEYCYYVAGTVGVMLSGLFEVHSSLIRGRKAEGLRNLAVSFGLGLQLTNILKDIREDRGRDVTFVPSSFLAELGLTPGDFLDPANREKALLLVRRLIGKARGHLRDALEFTCLLPRFEPRIRLFCLWPLFMAAETLALLAEQEDSLSGAGRVKIGRDDVARILKSTSLRCLSNRLIRRSFEKPLSRIDRALERKAGSPSALGSAAAFRKAVPSA